MGAMIIRDDQHGSHTAYSYGCRCEPCRDAGRRYRAETRFPDGLRVAQMSPTCFVVARMRWSMASHDVVGVATTRAGAVEIARGARRRAGEP